MVKGVLADPQDSAATMEVLYQNREPGDVLLKDELMAMAAANPTRLHLTFACSRANPKEFNTKERTFEQVQWKFQGQKYEHSNVLSSSLATNLKCTVKCPYEVCRNFSPLYASIFSSLSPNPSPHQADFRLPRRESPHLSFAQVQPFQASRSQGVSVRAGRL